MKIAAWQRAYRERNREKIAAGQRAYYERNREKVLCDACDQPFHRRRGRPPRRLLCDACEAAPAPHPKPKRATKRGRVKAR